MGRKVPCVAQSTWDSSLLFVFDRSVERMQILSWDLGHKVGGVVRVDGRSKTQ